MDKVELAHYEGTNDILIRLVSYFTCPSWASAYLSWKVNRKYNRFIKGRYGREMIKKEKSTK